MIVSLYIPDFPAWAHAREGGTAVAVLHRGRVIAATEALRHGGLRDGDPADRVAKRFPEAVIVDDDPLLTRLARERLYLELNTLSPRIVARFGDFICLDLPSLSEAQALSERLAVRTGYAPDDTASCLAAASGYVGRVEIVAAQNVSRFVEACPVGVLVRFGVSPDMISRLDLFGLRTIGALRTLGKRHWRAQFGGEGVALHDWLTRPPESVIPVWTPPETVSMTRWFESRVQEPAEWEPALEILVKEATALLDTNSATWFTVLLEDVETGDPWRQSLLFKRPTRDARTILTRIRWRLIHANVPRFGRITIELGGLVDPAVEQLDLFDRRPATTQACTDILRRYPRALVQVEEGDPLSPLPERRWRLGPMIL